MERWTPVSRPQPSLRTEGSFVDVLVAWHPLERRSWLLRVDDGLASVWVREGDEFRAIAQRGAGLDAHAQISGAFAMWFDGQRRTMVVALTLYGGVWFGAWDGGAFVPFDVEDPPYLESADAVAHDPRRDVLVHVTAQDCVIRELQGDAWREVARVSEDFYEVTAGWDAASERLVIVADSGEVYRWDGARLEPHTALPDWDDTEAPGQVLLPGPEGLTLVKRRTDGPSRVAVLGARGWKERPDLPATSWLAAGHDPARGTLWLFGAEGLGPEGSRSPIVELTGGKWEARGRVEVECRELIPGPEGLLVVAQRDRTINESPADSDPALALVTSDGDLRPLGRGPFEGVWASDATALRCVSPERGLFRLKQGAVERTGDAPALEGQRVLCLARDGERGAVLVGTSARREVLAWDADGSLTLTRVDVKGRPPGISGGRMAYVPGHGVFLVTGWGRGRGITAALDLEAGSWTVWNSGLEIPTGLLAHDAASGVTFGVIWDRSVAPRLLVWRGEGRWDVAGELTPFVAPDAGQHMGGPDAALAYDPATRRLLGYGEVIRASGGTGLYAVDLSAWLSAHADASPGRQATTKERAPAKEKAAPKKASPKKKAPAKKATAKKATAKKATARKRS
jgi:hypothetical protein